MRSWPPTAPARPVVLPERITGVATTWRTPAPLELYVDFETVSNLADDFTSLPAVGGQTLIFQIGCGRYEDGEWRFAQWTADRLTEPDEATVIGAWVDHIDGLRRARGLGWQTSALVHWSAARDVDLRHRLQLRPGAPRRRTPGRTCPGSTP